MTPFGNSRWSGKEIFFRRLEGCSPPWTHDPILARFKFTNAYRASDRVSQYLIRHVIYEGPQSSEEVFFRIVLFKVFNKIETWELLKATARRNRVLFIFVRRIRQGPFVRHSQRVAQSTPQPISCPPVAALLDILESTAITSN